MLDKQLCNLQYASSFMLRIQQVWGDFSSHDVPSKCSRPFLHGLLFT